MANRSYLYSTNVVPGPAVKKEERRLIGLSERNYDIPLVYRLLLSGGTRTCLSSIWENPDEIALIGDYAQGVERLRAFLKQIELRAAQPLIREALAFLERPDNRESYFLLECGEIFDMEDEPLAEQNAKLLEGIRNLDAEIAAALARLRALRAAEPAPQGLLGRLFGAKPTAAAPTSDALKPLHDLGLGYWSNVLYFDFRKP